MVLFKSLKQIKGRGQTWLISWTDLAWECRTEGGLVETVLYAVNQGNHMG